jgi:hypothetical protein
MPQKKASRKEAPVNVLKLAGVMSYKNAKGEIETLDLRAEKTTNETLSSLHKFPSRKKVGLQNTRITDKGLKYLSAVAQLEHLDIRSCPNVTDRGMKYVAKLVKLKELELYDTRVGDRGLECLASLKKLEELNIHSTKVTDDSLRIPETLPQLTTLELGGKGHLSDRALEHIKTLGGLEWLVLSESDFTDAALVHLKDLTRLKYLYIAWTPITGSGFRHLAGLSRLEHLFARDTSFTDNALKYLGRLSNLRSLSLSGTKITDKGLKNLRGLSKLKELDLEETRVTKQGKAELKKVLPRCIITISTDQGEEDVSRYDAEYFWNHPPRCVAGFSLKALRRERPTTFELICRCSSQTGKILGYPLAKYNRGYHGAEFVGPLGFLCGHCNKNTEIIDTAVHGYDGEMGASVTIRGKGKRSPFECPKCKSAEMTVHVHFEYDGGEIDLKEDEPTITVEDFFGRFSAMGTCANCKNKCSIAAFELA